MLAGLTNGANETFGGIRMNDNDGALALHDKATRDAPLSADEQAELDRWYAAQDHAEHILLRSGTVASVATDLQAQVTAVLERCVTLTQRIQALSHDNEIWRRDVAQLCQQVARSSSPYDRRYRPP